MLGALNARGFVDQDAQRFACAIKTVGKQAGIGIVQGLGNFFEVGSLGHDKFFLDGQGQCQTLGRCLRRPGRGLIEKIQKPETAQLLGFTARGNYRTNVALAFLATISTTGRLTFPLTLIHGEQPDFVLTFAKVKAGVECVEAVPKELYQIEVLRENQYPEAMNFGQKFKPGEENFSWDEKHAIASGRQAGPPWMPATAKRNWLSAMEYVVAGKTAKLRNGNYASHGSMWLLVRDEWPNSLQFYPERLREAAAELAPRLAPMLAEPAFKAIFIDTGGLLLCFEEGRLAVEEVCNLWN